MRRAAIRGIASHLPAAALTNEVLASELGDWDAQKIYEKTGITSWHIAADGECASDLAVAAAEKLFASGVCRPEEIDFLLFCTQSPDYFLPTTACGAQDLIVAKGGARRPRTADSAVEIEEKGSWRSQDDLFMNGPEIFNFRLKAVPAAVQAALKAAPRRELA
ncbi:MAG TPA: hypothetical protein VNN08_21480 [Thermoanaerobaculia bacterium]|nr:hypothetical protein [Thermoanaerobaculia bacterium]